MISDAVNRADNFVPLWLTVATMSGCLTSVAVNIHKSISGYRTPTIYLVQFGRDGHVRSPASHRLHFGHLRTEGPLLRWIFDGRKSRGSAPLHIPNRNIVGKLQIEPLKFSHFDYMWSMRANDVIFQKVISVMDSAHVQNHQ